MMMPSYCPACNKPMNNTFQKPLAGLEKEIPSLIKTCISPGHHISFLSHIANEDQVSYANILLKPCMLVIWDFNDKTVQINNDVSDGKSNKMNLPWFEPDFSKIKKLVNKIKTYIMLS
jgi:hypothetical protein